MQVRYYLLNSFDRSVLEKYIRSAKDACMTLTTFQPIAFACAVFAATVAIAPVHAETMGATGRVGVGVGTLGLMAEPSVRLSPFFGARAPFGAASISRTEDVEGNDVKGTLRLGGVALVGDVYPLRGGLRISGGVLASNFRLSGSATGDYSLEGNDYTGTFSARAEARKRLNPMISLGYDSGNAESRWSISGDLGVVYTNGLSGELNATTDAPVPTFDDDLAAARDSFRRDLGDVKILPYAKLAVTFRF
jgi:hypothetical protein